MPKGATLVRKTSDASGQNPGGPTGAVRSGSTASRSETIFHHAEDDVDHSHRLVAAEDEVDPREDAHEQDHQLVVQVEVGREEVAQAHEDGGGVGHEEDEDRERREELQAAAAVARLEKLRHGVDAVLSRDALDAVPEQPPDQEDADEGVAEGDPEAGEAEAPADLAREADEEHGGEVGGAVGEGRHEGPDLPAAEEEVGEGLRLPGPEDPDDDDEEGIAQDGPGGGWQVAISRAERPDL